MWIRRDGNDLRVLNRHIPSWSTVHNFKEDKTQISFNWGKIKIKKRFSGLQSDLIRNCYDSLKSNNKE